MISIAGFSYISGNLYIAVAAFVIYYMIKNVRGPLTVDYLSDRFESSVMATGLSGESQVKSLVTAIMAPLFGLAVERKGLGITLVVFGIFLFLMAVLLQLAAKKSREDADE